MHLNVINTSYFQNSSHSFICGNGAYQGTYEIWPCR